MPLTIGTRLWSQSYDRELDDIFAVQDDIAQAVVTELRAALRPRARTHRRTP
jgi:TolB-like protein